MNMWKQVAMLATTAAFCGSTAFADVKTQERTQVKFEGMLGKMAGMFGGKAAKEGLVSTVAVKGGRKMTTNGDTGELIDLDEQKIYRLDFDKKSYTVVTFAELRRQMQEAQKKAQENAREASGEKESPKDGEPQVEVDFDLKETGQKRTISGHECREVLMTVTVREKGKTLEQSGGMVLASSTWLAPEIAALKEQAEFDRRYAQKLYGDLISVEAADGGSDGHVPRHEGGHRAHEQGAGEHVRYAAAHNHDVSRREERTAGGAGTGQRFRRRRRAQRHARPEDDAEEAGRVAGGRRQSGHHHDVDGRSPEHCDRCRSRGRQRPGGIQAEVIEYVSSSL
jgi:hypothetical protein